ncbi:MAG: molybdenum cofactor biosynthesis protein MoaE [Cyanobacteriota bacterium]|nr:molybdenum cofactor biosynthesis protein MoaE [Cyanobacteriota bacterium]
MHSGIPGGTPLRLTIGLASEPFAAPALLECWQGQLAALGAAAAAESLFIGRVRGTAADGSPLAALELEHYPGMTERQLQHLAAGCADRHGVQAVLLQHRVGRIAPGDVIVLVAVAADRRGPAQRCCLELLEALKHDAPFWKREWLADGRSHWLTGNTPL